MDFSNLLQHPSYMFVLGDYRLHEIIVYSDNSTYIIVLHLCFDFCVFDLEKTLKEICTNLIVIFFMLGSC